MKYKIPRLFSPFPSIVHPAKNLIEAHTNKWIVDFKLVKDDASFEKYRKQNFASIIARSYPLGDAEDLMIWCDLNTLLFILDDMLDEQNIMNDKGSMMKFEEEFMEILLHNKYCTIQAHGSMFAGLSDFWKRMQQRSSLSWQRKFIQGINQMFQGGMWQFEHLIENKRPSLKEYKVQRQFLGAAHLATDSLEVTAKIFLKDEIYEDSEVKKLTELCRNTICWANDLFSLSKEIETKTGEFNLVSILYRTFNFSINEAIWRTAEIHNVQVLEFLELSKEIYKFDIATNGMLQRYVEALGYLMRGNIDWSVYETERYPHIYQDTEFY